MHRLLNVVPVVVFIALPVGCGLRQADRMELREPECLTRLREALYRQVTSKAARSASTVETRALELAAEDLAPHSEELVRYAMAELERLPRAEPIRRDGCTSLLTEEAAKKIVAMWAEELKDSSGEAAALGWHPLMVARMVRLEALEDGQAGLGLLDLLFFESVMPPVAKARLDDPASPVIYIETGADVFIVELRKKGGLFRLEKVEWLRKKTPG